MIKCLEKAIDRYILPQYPLIGAFEVAPNLSSQHVVIRYFLRPSIKIDIINLDTLDDELEELSMSVFRMVSDGGWEFSYSIVYLNVSLDG